MLTWYLGPPLKVLLLYLEMARKPYSHQPSACDNSKRRCGAYKDGPFKSVMEAEFLDAAPARVSGAASCILGVSQGCVEGRVKVRLTEGPQAAGVEFGRAAFCDRCSQVLQPGDLLYLPKGWWHFVKSLSTSISVAFHFT